MQCPSGERYVVGNEVENDYTSWVGKCQCGGMIIDTNPAKYVYNAYMNPYFNQLIVKTSVDTWDVCQSYTNLCGFFMDAIACPAAITVNIACGSNPTDPYYGTLMGLTANCSCGNMQYLDNRNYEIVIDNLVNENLYKKYWYFPFSQAAYTLVMATNPFKQLQ